MMKCDHFESRFSRSLSSSSNGNGISINHCSAFRQIQSYRKQYYREHGTVRSNLLIHARHRKQQCLRRMLWRRHLAAMWSIATKYKECQFRLIHWFTDFEYDDPACGRPQLEASSVLHTLCRNQFNGSPRDYSRVAQSTIPTLRCFIKMHWLT